MGKECFTCAHKESRDLSKEERAELQRQHIEKTGRKSLLIPDMEFTCKVSGLKINQTDLACDNYSGDAVMEDIRKELAKTAARLRKELKNEHSK